MNRILLQELFYFVFAAQQWSAEECVNAKHVSVEQPSGYISVKLGHKAHVATADCPWQVSQSNLSYFKLHFIN